MLTWSVSATLELNGMLHPNTELDAKYLALAQQFEVSIVEKLPTTTNVKVHPSSDDARRTHIALSAIKLDGQTVRAIEPTADEGTARSCTSGSASTTAAHAKRARQSRRPAAFRSRSPKASSTRPQVSRIRTKIQIRRTIPTEACGPTQRRGRKTRAERGTTQAGRLSY